jgi:hypothetical protein
MKNKLILQYIHRVRLITNTVIGRPKNVITGRLTAAVGRPTTAIVGRRTNNNFTRPAYFGSLLLVAVNKALVRPWLRRSVQPQLFIAALLAICLTLISCEKDFDINIKTNKPMLVVEGYINNEMRQYNYVAISRSLDYLSLDFQSAPVSNATVTITEGEMVNNEYTWNPATKVQLYEANLPGVPDNFKSGVYFDPRLITDSLHALLGTPGKSYLLEIKDGGNNYSAIATLLRPVLIDSLTTGFSFIDEDDNKRKLRITNHYQDPDTLNNTQLYYYRFSENRNRFGWGALFRNRTPGTDDVTNGQYMDLTYPRGYLVGDTVNYHMASVTRDVYNFWQSFNNARNNNGPFSTPVTLVSNIIGTNVTGCFSGMSLNSKTIIIK